MNRSVDMTDEPTPDEVMLRLDEIYIAKIDCGTT
jgi:hypothetical protein